MGGEDARVHLDLEICVRPVVQVQYERLQYEPTGRNAKVRTLLESDAPDPNSADINARWSNRKRGVNPSVTFRASHLLTSQVATRVPASTQAGREVHEAAETVIRALRGVFVLDPIPHAMRQYVPERDNRLRRQADNLSAVIGRLLEHDVVHDRLLRMVRNLSESRIIDMNTEQSPLGDLMLVQREMVGAQEVIVPARLMSDGTLRVLAILAALLESTTEAEPPTALIEGAATTLVIEEIENGLHPSQAADMVHRILTESRSQGINTLATTHSPAMLDALPGDGHAGVVICARDADGWTRLHRLTDLPNYFNLVTSGTLGDAATDDRLRPRHARPASADLVDRLFQTG